MKADTLSRAPLPGEPASAAPFTLARDAFGQLVLSWPDGTRHEGVLPVRAFPLQAPEHGVALVDADGHELAWVDDLGALAQPQQQLIREALRAREFMPEIQAIVGVTGFSTPCTWSVLTDRGATQFVLRGEEDIRRVGGGKGLLVTDSHGLQFYVRDLAALNRDSRRILDRFL